MTRLVDWQRLVVRLSRVHCADAGDEGDLDEAGWTRLLGYSRHHANYNLVAGHALALCPRLAPALRKGLERNLNLSELRERLFLSDLKALSSELSGTPIVVLKGLSLSRLGYPRPNQRFYRDVDILVESSALPAVAARLVALGYRRGAEQEGAVEFERPMPADRRLSLSIEVHTQLVNLLNFPHYRASLTLDPAALIERSRPFGLDGTELRALEAADEVVHLAVHGFYHHDLAGIKLYSDLDAHVERGLDFAALAERAAATGTTSLLGLTLGVYNATVGEGRVPQEVIAGLAPRGLRRRLLARCLPEPALIPFAGDRVAGHAAKALMAPRLVQWPGLLWRGLFPGRQFVVGYYEAEARPSRTLGLRYALSTVMRGVRRLTRST